MNQVTLNEGNIFVVHESYVDTACMVYSIIYLYYKYIRLAGVDLTKKTDTNTMCGR